MEEGKQEEKQPVCQYSSHGNWLENQEIQPHSDSFSLVSLFSFWKQFCVNVCWLLAKCEHFYQGNELKGLEKSV